MTRMGSLGATPSQLHHMAPRQQMDGEAVGEAVSVGYSKHG